MVGCFRSSRESYGDDAVGYVQIKRDLNVCTVKCRVCPEHKVRSKPYAVTVIVDEKNGAVISSKCHDCAASAGGCKHAVAFLMWLHRRSEEPSCTQVECYWKKSTLSKVGTSIKYVTTLEMGSGIASTSEDTCVYDKFLEEATAKGIKNCELLRYMQNIPKDFDTISMYQLALMYRDQSCEDFLKKISSSFTTDILIKAEQNTRDQAESNLWHELRFARITASKAYEVSKCQTSDGALVGLIMGGKMPDTPAIKRGRVLEQKVLEVVREKLNKEIQRCGLFISKNFPMIAGSPDGIGQDFIIEIKCPFSEETYKNYIYNGRPTKKFYSQMQIQMYVCGIKKCYFCVANSKFQSNNEVEIIYVEYDKAYIKSLMETLVIFWKTHIYPLLFKMSEM